MSHDILKKRKIQANITRKNCSRNTVHSRIQSLFQPRYLDHFCLLALFFTTYFFARQNKSTIVYAILRVQTLLFTVFTTLFSVPISSGLVWRPFWNLIQFDLEKIIFWLLFLCLLLFFLTQAVLPDKSFKKSPVDSSKTALLESLLFFSIFLRNFELRQAHQTISITL